MSLDEQLLARAVGHFRDKRVNANHDLDAAIDLLGGFPVFDDMEIDELKAYAQAALAQMGAGGGVRRAPAGGAGGGGNARKLPDYMSPFVFVTLPDEVVPTSEDISVGIPLRDGYCATITYELEAESPLLIGGEVKRVDNEEVVLPMQYPGGDYVIPGATLRGMVRSVVEIVAFAKLGSANLHHRFGLRDFEHGHYENVAQVDKVEAGWLTGGIDSEGRLAMQIEPCEWKHVLIEDMHGSPEFKGKVSARESWITKSLKEKYAALGMVARTSANGAVYDFGPGKTPGYTPAPDDRGRKVVKPVKGGMPGVPVVSDKLPGRGGKKKFEYAFFNKPGAVAVPIDRGIVEDFVRLNSKPSKNRPAPDGSWKELKLTFDAGHPIPVFYVGDLKMQGRDFFFGLTRMLKLPHKYSVGDLLRQQKSHKLDAKLHETGDGKTEIVDYKPDFIENLFGYVVEPKDFFADLGMESPRAFARKGRVAFSFATLKEGKATPSATVRVIQSAPRASFSPFYLKPSKPGQLGCEADYSAENPPRLAGRKRYLPRDTKPDHEGRRKKIADMGERQRQAVMNSSGGRPPSAEIESRLRFLLPATDRPLVFKGEIRLHNVTKAELGAVLFALTHGGNPNKPYRHMLGRARPFGAGQMRLRALDLAVEANDDSKIVQRDQDEKLSADTRTGFCRSDSCASLKPFLHAFVEFMRGRPGLKAFPQLPSILEFLGASEPAYAAGREDRLDYMPLREFNDIRKAVKARKDGQPPARPQAQQDGRLLPAPKVAKPVFWT